MKEPEHEALEREIKQRLDILQQMLGDLGCPEAELTEVKRMLGEVYVLVYPRDGSAGIVAQVALLRLRVEDLERQRKEAGASKLQVLVALIAALSAVIVAVIN